MKITLWHKNLFHCLRCHPWVEQPQYFFQCFLSHCHMYVWLALQPDGHYLKVHHFDVVHTPQDSESNNRCNNSEIKYLKLKFRIFSGFIKCLEIWIQCFDKIYFIGYYFEILSHLREKEYSLINSILPLWYYINKL